MMMMMDEFAVMNTGGTDTKKAASRWKLEPFRRFWSRHYAQVEADRLNATRSPVERAQVGTACVKVRKIIQSDWVMQGHDVIVTETYVVRGGTGTYTYETFTTEDAARAYAREHTTIPGIYVEKHVMMSYHLK